MFVGKAKYLIGLGLHSMRRLAGSPSTTTSFEVSFSSIHKPHTCCKEIKLYCIFACLHERGEPLVFLLPGLDELQCRGLVTTEGSCCPLDLLLFLPTELESAHIHTKFPSSPHLHQLLCLKKIQEGTSQNNP